MDVGEQGALLDAGFCEVAVEAPFREASVHGGELQAVKVEGVLGVLHAEVDEAVGLVDGAIVLDPGRRARVCGAPLLAVRQDGVMVVPMEAAHELRPVAGEEDGIRVDGCEALSGAQAEVDVREEDPLANDVGRRLPYADRGLAGLVHLDVAAVELSLVVARVRIAEVPEDRAAVWASQWPVVVKGLARGPPRQVNGGPVGREARQRNADIRVLGPVAQIAAALVPAFQLATLWVHRVLAPSPDELLIRGVTRGLGREPPHFVVRSQHAAL
mmetsp:Transcript_101573/g.293959  ORF Transcript_101573/g.293959 Transcript_101573/m.293959 type:complete len:271 (+) Transcript_101573:791-1603(+)